AVAVGQRGALVTEKAYGMADLEHDAPNSPATIYEAGSVSKQVVAAAIVLLALDGKLSLDEDISRWVPEVAGLRRTITLRHLLTHTSGLPDRYVLHDYEGRPAGEVDHPNAEVLGLVARLTGLNFEPGEDYLYSNTGYVVAVAVIERVSGRTLQQLSEERIFRPLGMTATRWREDHRVVVPARAAAYTGTRERGFRNDHPFTRVYGSGGLLTTVDDFLRWQAALQRGAAPWGAVRDSLERTAVLNDATSIVYGLGVNVTELRGVRQVTHTGSTGGYRAALSRFPERNLAVALLCNVGSVSPALIARRVATAALGLAPEPGPRASPPPAIAPSRLEVLAGVYHAPRTEEVLALTVRSGRLVAGRDTSAALVPLAEDRFRIGGGAATLVVVPAAAPGGRPRLRIEAPRARAVEYEPVPPPGRDSAALAPYAGSYRSPELGTAYRIALEKDTLRILRGWRGAQDLVPVYRDGFALGSSDLRFTRDPAGRITGFVVWSGRVRRLRFERVGPEAAGSGGH
ncbi:MAG TPA: serine hydrolase, partial [Gemmatimonadales bacterium]|nr:serine hydrolase [Gemmatimonadales bacterium]